MRVGVSQREMQGRDGNAPVINGAKVGSLRRIGELSGKAEPVIGPAAQVLALIGEELEGVSMALRRHFDVADLGRVAVREVNVDDDVGWPAGFQEPAHDLRAERFRRRPSRGVAREP